ncbi:hypothetical protein [Nitrosopumilus sp. b2]|uniref:hypothetical protein n=1 Tax=Nitrosopumilus sp. b2 TaxID=2109908 RepID=UPI0015F6C8C9|nr:hypothetical protein [Nitrosopumilus sp. b2]
MAEEMALRMVTMETHPDYVEGESKIFFNLPIHNPHNLGPICSNGITCFAGSVFYSITQAPFIAINHHFSIITDDTLVFSTNDFADAHYVFWRNSENVDLVFMELFYGPFLSAVTVGVFFLICLEQKFTCKNSIILSFLFAFSTIIWAYSNTSLNTVPAGLFLLLGYLFFKKFFRFKQNRFLLLSSASLGFAFLIRTDVILFIIPMWLFIFGTILKRNSKIHSLFFYSIPLIFSYFTHKFIPSLRFLPSEDTGSVMGGELTAFTFGSSLSHILTSSFGLLFAPGVGLFVFSPILLTMFFSFPDFFKKCKYECLLLASFLGMTLFFHADLRDWHGLVAWSSRYLVLVVPFLLLPLGASLEKRNKKLMFVIILTLGFLGVIFNLSYVVQDVSWFVWSTPGSHTGLFGLGVPAYGQFNLWINDIVIWTFQYSQLTHSISLMFEGLQHDIYLLHLFGPVIYFSILLTSIIFGIYLFWRIKSILEKQD